MFYQVKWSVVAVGDIERRQCRYVRGRRGAVCLLGVLPAWG